MKIMLVLRENGGNGGPHNSHLRIMNSSLSEKYDFVPLYVPKTEKMGLLNFKLLKTLKKRIMKERPDVIQIIGLEMIGFYLTIASRRAKVKKIILAIHGSSTESIAISKNFFKRKIMIILEKMTLKNADLTFGVSKYVYTIPNVARFSKNYFGHIYNLGVKPIDYNKNVLRQQMNISSESMVIVSTGRIVKEKGYALVTDIIKDLNPKYNITFLIVGDGNYLNEMRNALSSDILCGRVSFFGYQEDVSKYLAVGDVFLMASYHETLCMSLIEAGQYGLALIASDVGGMKEVVDNNESGFLIECGNKEEFINKILLLYNNKNILLSMQRKASIITKKRFSNESIIESLDKLYSSVKGGDE